MGFKAVYQTLRELFPQMDARLLKAVAIEHSKDPDAAVEYILNVVLPSTEDDKPTEPSSVVENDGKTVETSNASTSVLESAAVDGDIAYRPLFDGHNLDNDSLASSFYDANESHEQLNGNPKSVLAYLNAYEETDYESRQDGSSGVVAATGLGNLSKAGSSEALGDLNCVSSVASQDGDTNMLVGESIKEKPSVDLNTLECEVSTESAIEDQMPSVSRWNSHPNTESYSNSGIDINEEMNRFLYGALVPSVSVEDGEADVNVQQDCSNGSSSCVPELTLVAESIKEKPSVNHNPLECDVSTESAINDQIPSASRCNSHPNDDSEPNLGLDINQEMNSFPSSEFTRDFPETDAIGAENETLLSTIVTRSGQICRINLLEDIVEEAKNYKDTVCSAMESVVRLMEEVELKENEAEQAKVASVNGGLEILQKVEDIKKMLVHAKEANDMHSGEVYGEKSILATEVKELQARLFGLSDEKDRSLMMLDEMRNSLEDRLAVAEEQRRAAEKEIYDKQEVAQGALAEQELLMAKIVQDSKLLQQEAEENAKLRDFLVEKGQLVDVLQGEISVICQDVKLLKENFDNRVPLSKSLSIEQTSYRLASSNSSVKSSASLKSTTSLKSTASLKSTFSVKSIASDASVHSADQIKLPESPASVNQEFSGDWQSEGAEVGEKYVTHETTATKSVSDDDWELCDV